MSISFSQSLRRIIELIGKFYIKVGQSKTYTFVKSNERVYLLRLQWNLIVPGCW